jgi:hypothetical protein
VKVISSKTEAAALTAQAKAEKALEREGRKGETIDGCQPLGVPLPHLIAVHLSTGPSDEQVAVGAQKRPDHDPTQAVSHRITKRRELPTGTVIRC